MWTCSIHSPCPLEQDSSPHARLLVQLGGMSDNPPKKLLDGSCHNGSCEPTQFNARVDLLISLVRKLQRTRQPRDDWRRVVMCMSCAADSKSHCSQLENPAPLIQVRVRTGNHRISNPLCSPEPRHPPPRHCVAPSDLLGARRETQRRHRFFVVLRTRGSSYHKGRTAISTQGLRDTRLPLDK